MAIKNEHHELDTETIDVKNITVILIGINDKKLVLVADRICLALPSY